MPFGAEYRAERTTRFRLWAPAAGRVDVCLGGQNRVAMQRQDGGWFEAISDRAQPGSLYKFQIDGGVEVPDPASRLQPQGVHGPSEVVDANEFDWSEQGWSGRAWNESVIYELHVGAFTAEGTYAAVESRLDYLLELGVNTIELMPIAQFPGTRDWGYDGVYLFAPATAYGPVDGLKRLVQAAHGKGLSIILDVVYNHFGPEGNYLRAYAPQFFSGKHHTPWGEAINFDGPESATVRDFFVQNAMFWLEEYRFDGLRLDAVHAIYDDTTPDILTELAERVRAGAGHERQIHLILENDKNEARYLKANGAKRYDAQWNDDVHHALHVALTGETEDYYRDFRERPVERVGRCLTQGFDYQGEASEFRDGASRGECSRGMAATAFINFLQNHDQTGNRAFGDRIGMLADERAVKAAMVVLLLAPSIPMLFMGEEFGATTPFLFFCDFGPDVATSVTTGRREGFASYERFADPAVREQIPDPNSERAFEDSKLDWSSIAAPGHRAWLDFYRDVLRVRRANLSNVLTKVIPGESGFTMMGERAMKAVWKLEGNRELMLLANLGTKEVQVEAPRAGKILYAMPHEAEPALADRRLAGWSSAWLVTS